MGDSAPNLQTLQKAPYTHGRFVPRLDSRMTDLFVLQESEEIKSNKLDSELKLKETEFLQQQQEKSSQEEVLFF